MPRSPLSGEMAQVLQSASPLAFGTSSKSDDLFSSRCNVESCYLTTPLRPLVPTGNGGDAYNTTPLSVGLSGAVNRTPADLRWPLYTYLKSIGMESEILLKAKSIISGIVQQTILREILSVEAAMDLSQYKHYDRPLIEDLRRLYILAVLETPQNPERLSSLRNSLMSSHASLHQMHRNQLPMINTPLESVAESNDTSEDEEDLEGESILTFPDEPSESIHRSPKESIHRSPKAECGGSSSDFSASTTLGPGDTPLHLYRAAAVERVRISLLKDLIADEPTPVKLEVQRRVSALPTPMKRPSTSSVWGLSKRARKSPVTPVKSSSDYYTVAVIPSERSEACTPPRRSMNKDGSRESLSTASQSAAESIVESSVPCTAGDGTVEHHVDAKKLSRHGDAPSLVPAARASHARKVCGSSALLGVKGQQHGKRYQSRMAINAKSKRTREKKAQRAAALSAEASQNEEPTNDSFYARRTKRFERLNNSKFLEEGADWRALLLEYQTRFESPERAELIRQLQNRSGNIRSQLEYLRTDLLDCKDWREGQWEGVSELLLGDGLRHTFVALPTGAGKSLIYQLAALWQAALRHELAIVICPTTSLLNDQTRSLSCRLSSAGVNVGLIHSGVPFPAIRSALGGLASGVMDVLYTTPEQFVSFRLKETLSQKKARRIGLVVLDEAHCLSEWGHSFRPAYQNVLRIVESDPIMKNARVMMSTATSTRSTIKSISNFCRNKELRIISASNKSLLRPDLALEVHYVREDPALEHHQAYVNALASRSRNPGTILSFTWMKYQAEKVANALKALYPQDNCVFYHSGLEPSERNRLEASLESGKGRYVVCTQALGLGINVAGVSSVLHYTMPGGLEQYIQEIGRANREKALDVAHCALILDPGDYRARAQQIAASTIDKVSICHALKKYMNLARVFPPTSTTSYGTHSHRPTELEPNCFDLSTHSISGNLRKEFAIAINPPPSKKNQKGGCVYLVASETPLRAVRFLPGGCDSTEPRESMSGMYGLVVIDREDVLKKFNVRSSDELSVLLTILKNALRSLASDYSITFAEPDSLSSTYKTSWSDVLNWWKSNQDEDAIKTTATTSQQSPSDFFGCFETGGPGLELRFYGPCIETLAEQSPIFEFIYSRCGKQNGPVYKVYYHDLFLDCTENTWFLNPLDLDAFISLVQEVSLDHQVSVKQLSGASSSKKVYLSLFQPNGEWTRGSSSSLPSLGQESSTTPWTLWMERLISSITTPMERNHRIEINRLDAAWIAFKLGAHRNDQSRSMMAFINDYFLWDPDFEKLDSYDIWHSQEIIRYAADANEFWTWLNEPYSQRTSEVELATLRFDIEKVIDFTSTQGLKIEVRPDASPEEELDNDIFTPISAARVLCGIKSFNYDHTSGAPGWGKHARVKFSTMISMCGKIMKSKLKTD